MRMRALPRSTSTRREPASLGLSDKTAADSAFGEERGSYSGGDEDDEFDVPEFLR